MSFLKNCINLKICNIIETKLQHKHFPVNLRKFLRIPTLQNICEPLPLAVVAFIASDQIWKTIPLCYLIPIYEFQWISFSLLETFQFLLCKALIFFFLKFFSQVFIRIALREKSISWMLARFKQARHSNLLHYYCNL